MTKDGTKSRREYLRLWAMVCLASQNISTHQVPHPTSYDCTRRACGHPAVSKTHLRSPSQRDGTCKQVPDHILEAYIQALHMDSIDETKAILQQPDRGQWYS